MVYDGGEKMAITSSNQWPQQQQQQQQQQNMEERKAAMEKPSDLALKCPRCDSSNTKFCYYNNYSLSQPRHFCKACKRYWTRGGTLRNVPVGGGCRKNKRIKRPAVADTPSLPPPPPSRPHIDVSTPPSDVNRLIYGLPTTPSDVNLPFPHLNSAPPMLEGKVPYDLHQHQHQQQPHHLNSSSMWLSFPPAAAGDPIEEEYRTTGFKYNNNPSQISDAAGAVSSPSLLLPDYCSAFGFSSLEKQKLFANLKASRPAGNNDYHLYFPFHDLQMASRAAENSANQREMKMEQEKGIMFNNSFETDGASNSSLYWNADSTLFGSSSIAPLI